MDKWLDLTEQEDDGYAYRLRQIRLSLGIDQAPFLKIDLPGPPLRIPR